MTTVIIRPYENADAGLIYSSYPKGVYYGSFSPINETNSSEVKRAWFKAFYDTMRHQLETSTVLIACMSDDPHVILGYAILTGTTLEFIYVKEQFRKQGIAKLLLKHRQVETHNNITKVGHSILEGKHGTNTNAVE